MTLYVLRGPPGQQSPLTVGPHPVPRAQQPERVHQTAREPADKQGPLGRAAPRRVPTPARTQQVHQAEVLTGDVAVLVTVLGKGGGERQVAVMNGVMRCLHEQEMAQASVFTTIASRAIMPTPALLSW